MKSEKTFQAGKEIPRDAENIPGMASGRQPGKRLGAALWAMASGLSRHALRKLPARGYPPRLHSLQYLLPALIGALTFGLAAPAPAEIVNYPGASLQTVYFDAGNWTSNVLAPTGTNGIPSKSPTVAGNAGAPANVVTINSGGSVPWVMGAANFLDSTCMTYNQVVVNGGSVTTTIVAAYHAIKTNGNTCGSYNSVTLNSGTVVNAFAADIQSQGATGNASADNNTITINGGTVTGMFCVGYAGTKTGGGNGNASATNNTLNISGAPNLTTASLRGGQAGVTSGVATSTGNTLNMTTTGGITAAALDYFQIFKFQLPASMAVGGTLLTITGTANIGANAAIQVTAPGRVLHPGDQFTLISAASVTGNVAPASQSGTLNGYNYTITQSPTTVVLKIGNAVSTLTVTKQVTGDLNGYAGGQFSIYVSCTSGSKTMLLGNGQQDTLTVQPGDSCTLSETWTTAAVRSGYTNQATYPSSIIISGDRTVAVVNTIASAGTVPSTQTLTINKTVSGANKAVGHDPNAVFAIVVDCGNGQKTVNLKDGESGHVDVPTNATCTISEPILPPALGGYKYAPNIKPSQLVVKNAATISVDNMVVPSGTTLRTLTLTNTVTGQYAAAGYVLGSGNFTVTINCGAGYVWTDTMVDGSSSSHQVPLNNSCTVTPDTVNVPSLNPLYSWYSHIVTPNSPFNMGADTAVTVAHDIESTSTRTITVQKIVNGTGKAGGYVAGGQFAITVVCNGVSTSLQLADTGTGPVTAQVNDVCTVSEAAPGTGVVRSGYTNMATIDQSKFTVGSNRTVYVTNTVTAGTTPTNKLTINKTVSGANKAVGHDPNAVFAIVVDCGNGQKTVNLKDGESGLVEAPTNATCTISEPVLPPALGGYKYAPNIKPSQLVVKSDGTISVDNMVVPSGTTLRTLTLTNTVTGQYAAAGYVLGSGNFTVTINCGAGYVWTDTMVDGASSSHQVPLNNSCTVTPDTVNVPSLNPLYSWYSHIVTPSSPFNMGADTTVTVAHDIESTSTRTITVQKIVNGTGKAGGYVAGSQFAITVVCNGVSTSLQLADTGTGPVTAQVNDVCTVSEAAPGTGVVRSGYTNMATIDQSKFTVGGNRTVYVTNTVTAGTTPTNKLTINKTVSGANKAVGHDPNAVFAIIVDCGNGQKTVNLKDGESGLVEAPTNATCTISELVLPPALGGYKYAPNIKPSQLVVKSDGTISVDNMVVPSGTTLRTLTLTNTVTGQYAAAGYVLGSGNFTVTINCGAGYVWTDTLVDGASSSHQVPLNNSCTVTPDTVNVPSLNPLYSWYSHIVTPNSPFNMGADTAVTVAHDIETTGAVTLNITKQVAGDLTGYVAGGLFDITVSCPGNNNKTMHLVNGGQDSLIAQSGDTCTISEGATTAAVKPGYTNQASYPSSIVVGANARSIVVLNTIASAGTVPSTRTLTINKVVTGVTAQADPNAVFAIVVNCGTSRTINLMAGETGHVEVPANAACTISEPAPPPALGGYVYVANITPSSIPVVRADTTVEVQNVVTDSTTAGTEKVVTLSNAVSGLIGPSGYVTGSNFTLTLNCGTGYSWTMTMAEANVGTYHVPSGASCTVTTNTTNLPTLNPGYGWFSHIANPSSPFTVSNNTNAVVTHDIEKSTKTVTITTSLSGNTALYTGGAFDVTVTCDTVTQTFHFTPSGTQTLDVPIGETCTITGDDSNVILSSGTVRKTTSPNRFIVGNDGQTVLVDNELLDGTVSLAPINVTKVVTGNMAGYKPTDVFGITVTCPGTSASVKSLNLQNGQSGQTEAVVGDTCTLAEPTVPLATFPYMYAPIIPSVLSVPTIAGRDVKVTNNLIVRATTAVISFTLSVTDLVGSGYVPGSLFTTTINCGAGYTITLAAGDHVDVTMPVPVTCTTANAGALPGLSSGYQWAGPTTTPALSFRVTANGTVTLNYQVILSSQFDEPGSGASIPALDTRALLLLMGLLSGLALWQRRGRADRTSQ